MKWEKRGPMTQPINGKFEMPSLPYAASDLVPVLSAETIEFHYGKHLQFLAILNYDFWHVSLGLFSFETMNS